MHSGDAAVKRVSTLVASARRRLEDEYERVLRRLHPATWPKYDPVQIDLARQSDESAGEFAQLFLAHEGRLCNRWFHYFAIYDRHLARFRHGFPEGTTTRPVRLLEIGVLHGGGLQLWRKYLGPDAVIFGVDVAERTRLLDTPDLPVRVGSQADPDFLRSVVREMGGVDVVIDDGSHVAAHQKASFATLFPLLSNGGVYVVEDTHTSFWPAYGSGLRNRSSFVSLAFGLMNQMHGWYGVRPRRSIPGLDPKTTIGGIAFHDSVVVVDKKLHGAPYIVKVGERSFTPGADGRPRLVTHGT
jgi:hypothetical protein